MGLTARHAAQTLFSSEGGSTSGLMLLVIAGLISSLMSISQSSTTVAAIAAMLEGRTPLPFHPIQTPPHHNL